MGDALVDKASRWGKMLPKCKIDLAAMPVFPPCRSFSAAHTSMPMCICTPKGARFLQGGGIGAVALAVLYAFQERLVRRNSQHIFLKS